MAVFFTIISAVKKIQKITKIDPTSSNSCSGCSGCSLTNNGAGCTTPIHKLGKLEN